MSERSREEIERTAPGPEPVPPASFGVAGFCPMGCGETLMLGNGGHVTCSYVKCPNPTKVDEILSDPETEHVVQIEEEHFNLQHPLRERGTELLECVFHQRISALGGPPVAPGRYRVTARVHDGYSESFRSGDTGLRFEPIGGDGAL